MNTDGIVQFIGLLMIYVFVISFPSSVPAHRLAHGYSHVIQ